MADPQTAGIGAGCTCSTYLTDHRLVRDTTRCPIHSRPKCGALPSIGRGKCDLPENHEGAHMAFLPNGTSAWGFGG